VLVAEIAGEPVAALELEGEARLADPFHRTAHVVELLELHSRALRGRRPRRLLCRLWLGLARAG
jgi:hypothetical protein